MYFSCDCILKLLISLFNSSLNQQHDKWDWVVYIELFNWSRLADRIKARLIVSANSLCKADHHFCDTLGKDVIFYIWAHDNYTIRVSPNAVRTISSVLIQAHIHSTHTHTNPKLLAVGAHQANALADIPSNKHVRICTRTHTEIQTCGISCGWGWWYQQNSGPGRRDRQFLERKSRKERDGGI